MTLKIKRMNALKTFSLLQKVIEKGGLLGRIGTLYIHDVHDADKFLKECAAQCHIKAAVDHWGNTLVAELVAYAQGN